MNIKIDALNYYGATKKYHLHFPALREDIEADVVIIGGGFSGINTALELAEQGITNVVVLEARHLGYGGTGRNGGQVMAGIGHDIEAVKKHVGKEGLETLFKIANLGAGIIRERIRKYNIDADFVPGYGYLAYNQRQLKTLRQWEKEFKAATPDEEIELYTGKEVQQVVGSEVYCGALKHMGGGQIHSLNMLLGSAQAAHSLGVNLPRLRLLINAAALLLTGASVSVAGPIAFVGLLVPHLARFWAGHDHRTFLPVSALLGALFMLLADMLARALAWPGELPAGAVLALGGGPCFVWLVRRRG